MKTMPGIFRAVIVVLLLIVIGAGVYSVLRETVAPQAPTPARIISSFGRPDLSGTVFPKAGGTLTAPATVYIIAATPKTGVSTIDAADWPDCAKQAQTDAQGNFKIKDLDPALTFQVIAIAPGCQPATVNKVDPSKGAALTIALPPLSAPEAPPNQTLSGRVLDSQGHPIAGAQVSMTGYETSGGGGSYGTFPGIDPLAVTDDQGAFTLTDKNPFEMMLVKVSARSYADKLFDRLASGAPHDLVLTKGAELHGRLLLKHRPLGGVVVAVSGANRSVDSFLGHFEIGTDDQGNFDFKHLPPDGDFQIYTSMTSMKGRGAAPARPVHTGGDGENTDAGDLVVGPAHRLAGRVVLADDKPVPAKTRLYVNRESGWDGQQVTLAKDGSFAVRGVPLENISLNLRIRGYHLSTHNVSLDTMNPYQLVGRVDHDITNLVLLLEPGPEIRPDYQHIDPDYQAMRDRPLAGAEGGEDHSQEWNVAGHVYDQDSKAPVGHFHVTPGQINEYGQTGWKTIYAVEGANGEFQTYFSKRAAQPLLKVEAQGYLPASVSLSPQDTPNVVVYLQKGSGPAGSVVKADGQPAAGATLVLLTEGNSQYGLADTALTAYGYNALEQKADDQGNFSFPPALGMNGLAAASPDGFARMSLAEFAAHETIKLQPFGRLTGNLKRASGPGTNEILDLMFADNEGGRINIQASATTDLQGNFAFDHVPPGPLTLSYRQIVDPHNRGWTTQPLGNVDLAPGQTLTTNIIAPDRVAFDPNRFGRPPPPPKAVPGVEVKGVILGPDGQPVAGADVALRLPNTYLSIGRGAFDDNGQRAQGLIVTTGADGAFTLPMFEGAQSIIALNLDGYAQVSLEQLKQSPQVTLQKWGRIEGTLRINHRPGSNEWVNLSPSMSRWIAASQRHPGKGVAVLQPPMFNYTGFQAKTDDQGKFVLTFVPPGDNVINRHISTGAGSWMQSALLTVHVGPGETLVTNVGGAGRTVIGKITFKGDNGPDFATAFNHIATPMTKYLDKYNALKTDAERAAYYQSGEGAAAMKNFKNYPAAVQPDGTFRAEDVEPGRYEFAVQPRMNQMPSDGKVKFYASAELVVPPASGENDDSMVDWGQVEITEHQMLIAKPPDPAK